MGLPSPSIWIMQIFATFSIAFYCGTLGLSQIFNTSYTKMLLIVLAIVYVLSRIPKNINELFSLGTMIGDAAILLYGLLPLLLLLISRWRRL
ncbi:hypothetical protein E4V51_03975 [Paenibacillus sp. 28ISP30-2]|nr:hypothetical protein [Paenibacillus sp. 28ISP30-2]